MSAPVPGGWATDHQGKPSPYAPPVPIPEGAVGAIRSVGVRGRDATFVGADGIARTGGAGVEILRFEYVSTLLVAPGDVYPRRPLMTNHTYAWLDAQNQPRFWIGDPLDWDFGAAAERAWTAFLLPRCRALLDAQGLRFWCGRSGSVGLSRDASGVRVEVQQLGRTDVVAPKDLTVSLEGPAGFDLVLRADAFYEARYIAAYVTNMKVLASLLLELGAKPPPKK
jgi:hypothetical protein